MSEAKTITEFLAWVQSELKAPKGKTNDFGGYKYRNAEGIIAAYKGLDADSSATLTMSDSMSVVGDQMFLTATATLTHGSESISVTGCAMHSVTKKGMDPAQITGSASSYARKYALQGLFAIDDSQHDPDSADNNGPNQGMSRDVKSEGVRDYLKSGLEKQTDVAALDTVWDHPDFVKRFDSLPQPMQDEIKQVRADVVARIGGQQ